MTGRWLTSHIMQQDFVGWVGQGRTTDRSREHLAQSDRGIVMMRRRLQQQMEAVRDGSNELKGLIRDAEANRCIALPIGSRDELVNGLDRATFEKSLGDRRDPERDEFRFLVGQPTAVRDAYRAAMGLS
jgi:5,5'-dehydrodivanillate O-demethylase